MCSYLITTALYTYRMAINAFADGAFGMSYWWFKFASNFLFALELSLIFVYALLRRRAKADTRQWRADVEGWFAKAGAFRRAVVDFIRHKIFRVE